MALHEFVIENKSHRTKNNRICDRK